MGRVVCLTLAILAVAGAFFGVRPASKGGPPLRDFESYYSAGVTWRYQGDPYSREVWRTERTIPGIVASRDELLPFVGPPFGLPLWSALGRLPWFGAVTVWEAVAALAVAVLAFGSLALAGGALGVADAFAVLVVVAGFGPLTSGVALGQVAVLASAAVVAFPFAMRRGGIAGTFAAALLAALQPNLAVVLATRLGGLRAWAGLSLAALVAIGGSQLALAQQGGLATYVDLLRAHAAAERFITIQTTPAAVARALGLSAPAATEFGLALLLAIVAIVAWQCLSRRYEPDARLALGCAALPLTLTFAHEHDFTIAFLPAIFIVRRARGATWVAGTVAALFIAIDWLGLSQRPTGALATALLTLAAGLGFAALARERLRPFHALPALVATAAVAIAAYVASSSPLPTWPDALSATFHVARSLTAPEVWHAEQAASGVTTLAPFYGFLRGLSLLGCLGLWGVASVVLLRPVAERVAARKAPTARAVAS